MVKEGHHTGGHRCCSSCFNKLRRANSFSLASGRYNASRCVNRPPKAVCNMVSYSFIRPVHLDHVFPRVQAGDHWCCPFNFNGLRRPKLFSFSPDPYNAANCAHKPPKPMCIMACYSLIGTFPLNQEVPRVKAGGYHCFPSRIDGLRYPKLFSLAVGPYNATNCVRRPPKAVIWPTTAL